MSGLDEKLPESIDLSHHLSAFSRARLVSPLKGLQKYWGKPGMISLAGGLPPADLFPFSTIGGDILLPTAFPAHTESSSTPLSWFWNLFSSGKAKTTPVEVPRHASKPGQIDLATVLQYSLARGHPQLLAFARELTEKVYRPGYSDWTVIAHVGNTDAWTKAVLTLCNPGEGILTSEWTYPSAIASMTPYNIKPVPVGMDGEGMCANALREVLENWDEEARGMPRPHVMYTVPVGQNPTGATMGSERKKEIYRVCVEFGKPPVLIPMQTQANRGIDIIIIEDDPYFFLQEGAYHPPSHPARRSKEEPSMDLYLNRLVPSYLRHDYQGRVIRLETFSKTIAPGCRLGWFTCNPKFAERLERHAETSSQAPCGFGQGLVISLLDNWKLDGFIRWTQGLQAQYTMRRDFILDTLGEVFELSSGTAANVNYFTGQTVYTAYPKVAPTRMAEKSALNRRSLLSFVPPTSGMFVWLDLHFQNHPKHAIKTIPELEIDLWTMLAEAGVLFGPGQIFAAEETAEDRASTGHFRISFSNAEFDDMKKAMDIFAKVIVKFFEA